MPTHEGNRQNYMSEFNLAIQWLKYIHYSTEWMAFTFKNAFVHMYAVFSDGVI